MAEPLDRFITRRAKLAWAAARLAIHGRRVTVAGQVCHRYHQQLDGSEVVTLDDEVVADGPDDGVVLCHKPAGWACSHELVHAPLLYDLVPAALRHPDLQAAGRLDRDTTGLIVLTIDGALIQRITEPGHELWKRYRLRYEGGLVEDASARVAAGLPLPDDDRPCLPARLELGPTPGEASLELREGRHHQVKRMIAALGGRVVALHRDRLGTLHLPGDLSPGAMRAARPDERAELPLIPYTASARRQSGGGKPA